MWQNAARIIAIIAKRYQSSGNSKNNIHFAFLPKKV